MKIILSILFLAMSFTNINTKQVLAQEISKQINSELKLDETMKFTGVSSIKVVPDVATIYYNVTTENANEKTALDQNKKLVNKINDALVLQNVQKENIQLINFNTSIRDIDYITGQKIDPIYNVTHSQKVLVKDLKSLDKLINIIVTNGATVGNISFEHSEIEKFYDEALEKSIKDAERKANKISKYFNKQIKLVNFEEHSTTPQISSNIAYKQANSIEIMQADSNINNNISIPEIDVNANVTLTYK